ncbi:MAG TPA: hypothetical protein VF516_37530 [Kofleriaceae bacterium]
MNHVTGRLFVLSLVATGLLAFSARVRADSDQSVTRPLDVTVSCGTDTLHITGEIHRLLSIRKDDAGGLHILVHSNYQGVSGTNQDGVVYHASHVDSENLNIPAGGSREAEVREDFHLVGQGDAPEFTLREFFHFTFDANGNMTSFQDHSRESECGEA